MNYILAFHLLQLWRVSETEFQLRTSEGQFLTCDGEGGYVTATSPAPSINETFYIERNNNNSVHIKLKNGGYLRVCFLSSLIVLPIFSYFLMI